MSHDALSGRSGSKVVVVHATIIENEQGTNARTGVYTT